MEFKKLTDRAQEEIGNRGGLRSREEDEDDERPQDEEEADERSAEGSEDE